MTEEELNAYSYGVSFSETGNVCTRIGNMEMHKSLPIQSQYQGCVVKDGKVQYWLADHNWNYKKSPGICADPSSGVTAGSNGVTPTEFTGSNNEASCLDGTDGDVMVHIPKFYGHSETDSNGICSVRISTTKCGTDWVEIPEMYVGAWRCTRYTENGVTRTATVSYDIGNETLRSKYLGGNNRADLKITSDITKSVYNKPRTSEKRASMRTYAQNAGKELLNYEFYKWVFYWSYVIEYANFDSQATFNDALTTDGYHQGGLGVGVTSISSTAWNNHNLQNPLTPCGYTNSVDPTSGSSGNGTGIFPMRIPQSGTITYSTTSNGVTTTVTDYSYTASVPRWRGFENPFGDIWTILDGVVSVNPTGSAARNMIFSTTDVSVMEDMDNYWSNSSATASGFISQFADYRISSSDDGEELASSSTVMQLYIGSKGDIIPYANNGSSKRDYHYSVSSAVGRCFRSGGSAAFGSDAGLGYLLSSSVVGVSGVDYGFFELVRA